MLSHSPLIPPMAVPSYGYCSAVIIIIKTVFNIFLNYPKRDFLIIKIIFILIFFFIFTLLFFVASLLILIHLLGFILYYLFL